MEVIDRVVVYFIFMILAVASFYDVAYRRIPNKFVLVALISVVFMNIIYGRVGAALISGFFALMIAMPLYLIRAVGAGDVKVFMTVSMFLDFRTILNFGMISLIVTVVYGLVLRILWGHKGLTGVPMAPGLLVGALIVYMTGGI